MVLIYLLLLQCVISFSPVVGAEEASPDHLLDRLDRLETNLQALQQRSLPPEVVSASPMYEIGQLYDLQHPVSTEKVEFQGTFRTGGDISRFTSQSVVSRITEDAEQSLQRLDEFLARVERIVEQSGAAEAEALFRDAILFRNQAAGDISAGDRESALQNLNIAESLAIAASRAAGEEITWPLKDRRRGAFSEIDLEWNRSAETEASWRFRSRTRKSDESVQQRMDLEMEWPIGQNFDLLLRSESRLRIYQEELLEDDFNQSLFTRLRWRADPRLTVRLENVFDYKTEYRADPDKGYWSDSPKLVVQYRWGWEHLLEVQYNYRRQDYFADNRRQFDSRRHNLRQSYEFFGTPWRLRLEAAQQWRTYQQPDEENDDRDILFGGRISRDLFDWLTVQLATERRERRYRLLGRTNTDYDEWMFEPEIQFQWSDRLYQSLRYTGNTRRYIDRDNTDGLRKRIGDYREHRLAFDTWWLPTDRLSLSAVIDRQWRRYPNGQTGEYEIYLPDYRPVSNYNRWSLSLLWDWRIMERMTLSGSLYRAREKHKRFDAYNVEETSANIEVRIAF